MKWTGDNVTRQSVWVWSQRQKYFWRARNIQPPHITETVQLYASLRIWRQYGILNLERGGVNEDQAKKGRWVWVLGKWLQGTDIAVTFPEEA